MSFSSKMKVLLSEDKQKYGHFSKLIFAEGRFPATPSFWRSEKSGKSRSSKVKNRKKN